MSKNYQALQEYNRLVSEGIIEKSPRKSPLEKALEQPTSLRLAINAKCYDCGYDHEDVGSWRDQIRYCPSTDCPLYPVRQQ